MTDTRHSSASHKHWKLDWWDLWPLTENDDRPVQWTSDSLILSAHQPVPAVSARLFPGSHTFLLPSPPLLIGNPSAYLPPTIIEGSPCLSYIFAYFPSKTEDNLACIWSKNGKALDSWKVDTSWPSRRGQGFVLAKWLGRDRSWSAGNPPSRGCSLGPPSPFGRSRLILVSQNHVIHLVDRILHYVSFQIASCSLLHSSRCNSTGKIAFKDMINGPGGVTVCTKAAIGLGHGEESLIVAMQSTLVASAANLDFPDFTTINQPPLAPQSNFSWDSFGLENTIQLCEVKLSVSRFQLCIETIPLLPLVPHIDSFSHLTNISITSVCSSHQGLASKQECESEMYMTLTYVDLENHFSPRSHLVGYSLKRRKQSELQILPKRSAWTHTFVASRTLEDSVVTFLTPAKRNRTGLIFTGLLDLQNIRPTENGQNDNQQIIMGKIVALRIPSFEDDPLWEHSNLIGVQNETGFFVPTSCALSPNETLLCTANPSWDHSPKISVHPIIYRNANVFLAIGSHPIHEVLAASILSVRTDTDILHLMTGPGMKNMDAYQILFSCLRLLKTMNLPNQDVEYDLIKVIIPLFKARARLSGEQRLKGRSDAALDVCSLRAINDAFSYCKDEAGYDTDSVWNLIALYLWFMDYLLRLFRDLILLDGYLTIFDDLSQSAQVFFEEKGSGVTDDDLSVYSIPPSIMHLIHPYMLRNLIGALSHIVGFRAYLDSLTASKLKSVLAKEVLIETQEDSGLNLNEIESELRKIAQMDGFKVLNETFVEKSMCMMHPVPELYPLVLKICRRLLRPAIISKSRVFIEAKDVVVGVSRPTPGLSQDRDSISKTILVTPENARICAVCKGKTEIGNLPFPKGKDVAYSPWALWEHGWNRCTCGGVWLKASTR